MALDAAPIEWTPRKAHPGGGDFTLAPDSGDGWMACRSLSCGIDLTLADFCPCRKAQLPFRIDEPAVGFSFYLAGSVRCRFSASKDPVVIRGGERGIFRLSPQDGEGEADCCRTAMVELRLTDSLLRQINADAMTLGFDQEGLKVGPVPPGVATIAGDLLSCPYSGLARELFFEAKALELLAHVVAKGAQRCDGDLCRMQAARDHLVRKMADPPDLRELAREAGLSRTRFAERFRELFGMPPFAYLRERRLETAMAMLSAGSGNVTETALAVGYTSLSHFARAFRERFGIPPSAVRPESQAFHRTS